MDDDNTFILTDEDGNEFTFQLMDFFEYEEQLYAIFTPSEEDEDLDEVDVVIMKTVFEGEDPVFSMIEDEDLSQNILNAYIEMVDSDDSAE